MKIMCGHLKRFSAAILILTLFISKHAYALSCVQLEASVLADISLRAGAPEVSAAEYLNRFDRLKAMYRERVAAGSIKANGFEEIERTPEARLALIEVLAEGGRGPRSTVKGPSVGEFLEMKKGDVPKEFLTARDTILKNLPHITGDANGNLSVREVWDVASVLYELHHLAMMSTAPKSPWIMRVVTYPKTYLMSWIKGNNSRKQAALRRRLSTESMVRDITFTFGRLGLGAEAGLLDKVQEAKRRLPDVTRVAYITAFNIGMVQGINFGLSAASGVLPIPIQIKVPLFVPIRMPKTSLSDSVTFPDRIYEQYIVDPEGATREAARLMGWRGKVDTLTFYGSKSWHAYVVYTAVTGAIQVVPWISWALGFDKDKIREIELSRKAKQIRDDQMELSFSAFVDRFGELSPSNLALLEVMKAELAKDKDVDFRAYWATNSLRVESGFRSFFFMYLREYDIAYNKTADDEIEHH